MCRGTRHPGLLEGNAQFVFNFSSIFRGLRFHTFSLIATAKAAVPKGVNESVWGQGRNRYFLYLWLPTVLTDQIVLTGSLARVPTVPTRKYKKYRRMSVNYGLLLGRSGGGNISEIAVSCSPDFELERLRVASALRVNVLSSACVFPSFLHLTHQPPTPHTPTHNSHVESHAWWARP